MREVRRMANETRRSPFAARNSPRPQSELALEQFVHGLRIGLAARRLHHLTDEPADQRRLRLRLRHLVRVAWRRCRRPPSRSRTGRSPASSRAPRRSRADRRPRSRRSRTSPWRSCRKSCRRAIRSRIAPSCAADTGEARDVPAFLVQPAGELVDHPIGGRLGVAAVPSAS